MKPTASPRRLVVATWIAGAALLAACAGTNEAPEAGARRGPSSAAVAPGPPCADVALATRAATPSAVADPDAPEIATGFATRDVVFAPTFMAVTANAIASRAACDVLAAGGHAVDAAIAAQMVLNVVEPQSSGIGGGAFLLVWDATRRTIDAYDGRETAPAAATPDDLRFVDAVADRTTPRPSARASGRSIGVPGALRMLELAHREHGRLPWRTLIDPAIALASDGFRISPRLSASIAASKAGIARDLEGARLFLDAAGDAKRAGTRLVEPALAATLDAIARGGADAFYGGDIARDVVARVASTDGGTTPGRMTLADLAGYRAKHRAPVCAAYRAYEICSMGPPSSGGIAVEATLGILESFDLSAHLPHPVDRDGGRPDPLAAHWIAEAERLAYADRDRYVADPDFVPLPGGDASPLLDRDYLRGRAATIRDDRSMGRATAGDFGTARTGVDATVEHGTSQLTIADRDGNVVAMTTSVESGFGAFHFVRGFALNNQLTDFSSAPVDAAGAPIANRVEGGKRPRSAMAPTLVFRRGADGSRGDFVLATGSAGGFWIIQYVVKSLVGALDWGLDAQQAVSSIDFGAANGPTTWIGGEHPDVDARDDGARDPLVAALRARGHVVSLRPQASGLTMLGRVVRDGRVEWSGGADPRREGAAIGR